MSEGGIKNHLHKQTINVRVSLSFFLPIYIQRGAEMTGKGGLE